MARSLQRVDVAAILDGRRLGNFHLALIGMCALALFAAGYDAQVLRAAAQDVARDLDLPASEFMRADDLLGIGSVLGMIVGGLGDRIGRRRAIMLSLAGCGAANLACVLATEPRVFAALRFVAGLALGAVLPNALTLLVEMLPKRRRLALASLAWAAYPAGIAAAAPITASLLTQWSWKSVFVVGGLLPVVLMLVLWGMLPESALFMARDSERWASRIRATMRRISRRYDFRATVVFLAEPLSDEAGPRFVRLFRHRRAIATLALWVAFALAALTAALYAAALPNIAIRAAIGPDQLQSFGFTADGLGALGGVVLALVAGRGNRFAVLAAGLVLGIASLAAVVLLHADHAVTGAAFAAAFFLLGASNALGAFAAVTYPTTLRATGTGWALAAGRLGQAAAGAALGVLAHYDVSLARGLVVIAAVAVLAAGAALVLLRYGPPPATPERRA